MVPDHVLVSQYPVAVAKAVIPATKATLRLRSISRLHNETIPIAAYSLVVVGSRQTNVLRNCES